jgi:hypothetical protein
MVELQETLANSFLGLGLTENQEAFFQNMIGDFMQRMAELLDRGVETQTELQNLNDRLEGLRPPEPPAPVETPEPASSDKEESLAMGANNLF